MSAPRRPVLTDRQRLILETAAARSDGLVTRPYLPGFEGVSWDRNASILCVRGYLLPYVHGGFEITDEGRSEIAKATTPQGGDTP